jgi:hypothetical protein
MLRDKMLKEKTIKRTKRQKEKSPTGIEQRRLKKTLTGIKCQKVKSVNWQRSAPKAL